VRLARLVWIAAATSACGNQGAAAGRDALADAASRTRDAATNTSSRVDSSALGTDGSVSEACGDVDTDPHNCGACGHDCDGGACLVGSCEPLPAGVLASGQHTPFGIVLDEDNVYWLNRGAYSPATRSYGRAQLMKCAKAGCGNAPTVLASGLWTGMTRLALGGGMLYWAAVDLLLACSTDGCAASGPAQLLAGTLDPADVAVGATTIYFADSGSGAELLTCPLAGCGTGSTAISTPMPSSPPAAIAVAGTTVYFGAPVAGSSFLFSCGAAGCSSVSLFTGATPTAIALDGANVYLATEDGAEGRLASCPQAGCEGGNTTLTTSLTLCAGVASDGTTVYFTDRGMTDVEGGATGAGRVAKCSVSGCNGFPTPVAGYVNVPQQVAVDGTSVYWTDFGSGTDVGGSDDGRVMAVPK